MKKKRKKKEKAHYRNSSKIQLKKIVEEAKLIPSRTKTQDLTSSWIGTALHYKD